MLKIKSPGFNITYVVPLIKLQLCFQLLKMKLKNESIRRRGNIHKIRKEQRTFKTEKNKDSTSNFWDNCKHEIKSVCSYMNFEKLVSTLHKPVSPRSLGAIRALFGKYSQKALHNYHLK